VRRKAQNSARHHPDNVHGFWYFERKALVRRNDIRSLPGLLSVIVFECNSGDRGRHRLINRLSLFFGLNKKRDVVGRREGAKLEGVYIW